MHRVIVTGGRGFIGRHLLHALQTRGMEVTTLGRKPLRDTKHIVVDGSSWTMANMARILEAQQPAALFHFAGTTVGTQDELEQANVGLTEVLLQALRQTGLRPLLIIAGSAAEYGAGIVDGVPVKETTICAPMSAYGKSKLAQTRAALAYAEATDTPLLLARIFNPIGPGMPPNLALGGFAAQIAALRGSHGTIRAGNLDIMRDFTDVEHTATLICNLAFKPRARGLINICSGEASCLRKLLDMLILASGKKIDVETDPSRFRSGEQRVIVGSTELLTDLGESPPQTDYSAVIDRIWAAAERPVAAH